MEHSFDYKSICYIHYSLIKIDYRKAPLLFVCFLDFFIKMIGYLLNSPRGYKKVDNVLVVIPSSNNKRSVFPILEAMRHRNYTCVDRFYNFLPLGKIYLKSLLHTGSIRDLYRHSPKEEKRMIRAHFRDFAPAKELYLAIGEFFDNNPQIKLLVVSNDHFPIIRSFIEQARAHCVKIVYTQHASVSGFFPPLVFDYSFLDGKESFLKYQSIDKIDGRVFLSGSPRFDIITRLKKQSSDLIGIAFNELDANNKIIDVIHKLKDNGFTRIVVRPHPRQERGNPDWSLFLKEGCLISYPSQENPFLFLSRLSFLIAGASSIHLDAALLQIPSTIYNFQINECDLDYYGYARMGLTPIAETGDDLVNYIKNPQLPGVDTIRYYDAAYGTEYEGKSASLAASIIDAFLDGNENTVLETLFEKSSEGYYVIKNK